MLDKEIRIVYYYSKSNTVILSRGGRALWGPLLKSEKNIRLQYPKM